jgi:hypothetical protein
LAERVINGSLKGQHAKLMRAIGAMEVIREPLGGGEWLGCSGDRSGVVRHGDGELGGGNREGNVEVLRLRCQAAQHSRYQPCHARRM